MQYVVTSHKHEMKLCPYYSNWQPISSPVFSMALVFCIYLCVCVCWNGSTMVRGVPTEGSFLYSEFTGYRLPFSMCVFRCSCTLCEECFFFFFKGMTFCQFLLLQRALWWLRLGFRVKVWIRFRLKLSLLLYIQNLTLLACPRHIFEIWDNFWDLRQLRQPVKTSSLNSFKAYLNLILSCSRRYSSFQIGDILS